MKIAQARLFVVFWFVCVVQCIPRVAIVPKELTVVEYVVFLLCTAAFLHYMIPNEPMTRMVTGVPIWFTMSWWLCCDEKEKEQ